MTWGKRKGIPFVGELFNKREGAVIRKREPTSYAYYNPLTASSHSIYVPIALHADEERPMGGGRFFTR